MFSIDLTSRVPIYEQICNKITDLVLNGTLSENQQLPSVRSFAKDSGVNPNTVAKAYQELERNGIIYSVPGRGSFIAKQKMEEIRNAALRDFDNVTVSAFDKGIPPNELKESIDKLHSDYGKGK
ncbi:MAG: GntR family transcriptional regulator [Ruminococcus sp.]|nr:GntR family transcriptional regulator [Ruminococcus sp.]